MMRRFTKRDIINLLVLSLVYVFIIGCILGVTNIYGSTIDWTSQHWVIPEYLRNRFYETGQFLPSFAFETGAGQNIYYLAYYGLLSPFLFLSYCFPFIAMRDFIVGINILSVFASVWFFYIWFRGKYSSKVAFITSFLFLTSSPLIFHSHRHIMFVDYLPYLILAFIFVRRYFQKKSGIIPIILCAFGIVTTSFFFSIGSFIAIGVYGIIQYLEKYEKFNLKECIIKLLPIIGGVIISVMMAGILLIPTALALMSGRDTGSSSSIEWNLLIPQLSVDLVLYNTYSMGLSAISVCALVFSLIRKNRGYRFLAGIVVIICTWPIVTYFMNGLLYLDGKALIPFLPVVLLVTAEFFENVFVKNKSIKIAVIIGSIINIIIIFTDIGKYERIALIVETVVIILCFIIYYWKRLSYIVCIPIMITSLLFCLTMSLYDEMPKYDARENTIDNALLSLVNNVLDEDDEVYRFSNGYNKGETVNKVINEGYYQTTIYSSACNSFYSDFYLNQMKNEVQHRNASLLTSSGNLLFNMYMGVKYYMTESAYVPAGYEEVSNASNVYLYKSEDVYPIGYATSKVLKENTYLDLEYPYTTEALMKMAIVDEDLCNIKAEESMDFAIEEYEPKCKTTQKLDFIEKTEDGYFINVEKNTEIIFDLEKPLKNKVMYIVFDVDNCIDNESSDVYVQINSIRNKLTKEGWKYHNKNFTFEYVISSNEDIESLDILFSKGKYNISNLKFYILDYDEIGGVNKLFDEFVINKEKTFGDVIEGSINVKEDGWFHLSIPYDEGFTIKVDGKEVEYGHSDIDFIGFNIEKGKHEIKFEYTAPGMKLGKIISVSGLIMFAIVIVTESAVNIRKRRK